VKGKVRHCFLFTDSMVRREQREGVGIFRVGKTAKAAAVVLHVAEAVANERVGVAV
jgi:hypothetical protein